MNVGCVPKKVMWNVANHAEHLHDLFEYGFETDAEKGSDGKQHHEKLFKYNLKRFKQARDAYITRLHGIYDSNLQKDKVEKIVCQTNSMKTHTLGWNSNFCWTKYSSSRRKDNHFKPHSNCNRRTTFHSNKYSWTRVRNHE